MSLKEELLRWNSEWPFDFWYRQKYNIPFKSEAHLELSQIDMKMDYIEKKMAERAYEEYEEKKKLKEEYQKDGIWLKRRENKKLEDDLWDKMDFSKIK